MIVKLCGAVIRLRKEEKNRTKKKKITKILNIEVNRRQGTE
jgi:hypothetical protein